MDEKIEKVISLAGNEHRYQYFTLGVVLFLWIHCNFISCVLPFIEREPIVNYNDTNGILHENVTLTSDICAELDGKPYEVVETFGYSLATEFHIECENFEIGAIGSFAMAGNAAGGFVFSFISKLISHKKILIISSFGFCIAAFLSTLVTSFDYFYCLLVCEIFIGLFGNCLCYSSLVVAQEIVAGRKRSLFNSIINVGYALCGIIYAILFMLLEDWRKVYYVLIGASLFTLILIWVFIYDSPRGYINNNNYDKVMNILEGIASFNGKLEEFRESIKQDEYQDVISVIKGEKLDGEGITNDTNYKKFEDEDNNEKQKEDEHEFSGEISEGRINDPSLSTSLINKDNQRESTISKSPIKIQKINVWSLFKYPSIRYKFLLLNFLWVGTRASFNGVSIASKSFPGNFYVNIIVLFILEAVAYTTVGFLIDIRRLGRRGTLWIQYVLVIIMFVLLAFLELDTAGSLAFNYITRFCCAGIEVIYYTYSIEIYPTPVRSLAFGINATFGNAGSIFAPFLLEFLLNWQFLILFAVVCAINAVVLIFLPETVGKPMVETIKELEEPNTEDNKDENKEDKNDNVANDDLSLEIMDQSREENKDNKDKNNQENKIDDITKKTNDENKEEKIDDTKDIKKDENN